MEIKEIDRSFEELIKKTKRITSGNLVHQRGCTILGIILLKELVSRSFLQSEKTKEDLNTQISELRKEKHNDNCGWVLLLKAEKQESQKCIRELIEENEDLKRESRQALIKSLAQAKEEEREKILKQISKLFDAGWTIEWTIEQTSCPCGGIWAWWKPRFPGAQRYAGCVCHTNILEEALKEKK